MVAIEDGCNYDRRSFFLCNKLDLSWETCFNRVSWLHQKILSWISHFWGS